jgi:type VI secretion system protein ImpA
MERAAQGKPEQQYGDTVIPAEEPNWGDLKRKAADLLSRTKDLRVAVYLGRALLKTEGLVGLADGLELLRGLLERYWEGVHPRLDPDDDDDPTLRVNTIASLCDPETVLPAVREAPLVSAAALGRYSLRDVQLATGAVAPPDGVAPPDIAAIDAAFLGCSLEDLQETADAVRRSVSALEGVESLLTERVGVARAVDLSALTEVLRAARQVLDERLARRGAGAAGARTEAPVPDAGGTDALLGAGESQSVPPATGEIRSREDVVRLLDKVCDYFRRNEPSSPVPLLLERAKRLVSKSFLEIVRDLAPDGVTQVETIRGPEGGVDSDNG